MNLSILTSMNGEGDRQNHWSYMVVLALEIVIGISVDVFIIYIALYDFGKTKAMSSLYKILLCLCINNIFFYIMVSVGFLDYFYHVSVLNVTDTAYVLLYLSLISTSSCAWHTATLGFFYCIKVSDVKFSVFAWTKRKIKAIVPWMLLLSVVVSILCCSVLFLPQGVSSNITDVNPSLMTALTKSVSSFINAGITVTIAPLLVISITTASTVVSLKKHSHRMKSVQTSDGERFKSYEKIVSRIMQSLIFYIIFDVVMVIVYFTIVKQLECVFWLTLLMLASFSPVQTMLLVLANPRLRAAGKDIFLCVHLRKLLSR